MSDYKPHISHVLAERRSLAVVLAAFLLPLIGIAGYRVLENRKPEPPSLSSESASISPDEPAVPEFETVVDQFHERETVTEALQRHGLTSQEIFDLVQAARPAYSLSKVIAGRDYTLHFRQGGGSFHDFVYRIDDDRYLTVYREGERFVPVVKKFVFETRVVPVAAEIEDSLFMAVTSTGEQEPLALDLAKIFMWDVDFYTDIQKGDSFRMLLEKKYLDGKFDRYGDILAAEITVQGKCFPAFRFEKDYYDDSGKSLRKSFLKSPLQFTRISSRFSAARMHPILKVVRPHYGIDYAAPRGTPVVAVASGKVISAGVNGGFGKSVHLRHSDGYESIYSHLSRIDVRTGTQVSQGERIGAVGMTGLATGPHLDFRLLRYGKYRNPATEILPPAKPVAAEAFPRFASLRDDLLRRLDLLTFAESGAVHTAASSTGNGESEK